MATAFSENLTAEQQSQVLQLFQQFQHPTLQKDLIELKTLKKVEKGGDVLRIELQLPFAWNTGVEQVKQQLSDALLKATVCAAWARRHRILCCLLCGIFGMSMWSTSRINAARPRFAEPC